MKNSGLLESTKIQKEVKKQETKMKAPIEEKQEKCSTNAITTTATVTTTATTTTAAMTPPRTSSISVKPINSNSNATGAGGTSSSNCSFIKPSLSMTSLPPKEQHDGKEIIKAKLRMERPYNSLKKKRNNDIDTWRHSWGSAHSHSSCSLHSNATGGGFNIGKDDFWAALQTNYNYIMDTHLLDTCKEARREIEGAASSTGFNSDCCQKRCLQSSQPEGLCEDPKELRKWLREMENKLSKAPSLSEATQMSILELQKRLAEHSVLYCEIVSHARVVGACVRASEKENSSNYNSLSSEDKSSLSPNSKRNFDGGNLKGLERRYHLLYLKAIEVQCLFEGLLGKKNSSSILSRSSSTETDDEPASKLARLSDSETTNTHASCDLLSIRRTISDENKSEDEEGEDWPDISNYNNTILNTEEYQTNANDFDADSEGSDSEQIITTGTKLIKINNQFRNSCKNNKLKLNNHHHHYYHHHQHHHNHQFYYRSNKLTKYETILSENMDSNSYKSVGSIDYIVTDNSNNNKLQQNSNQSGLFHNTTTNSNKNCLIGIVTPTIVTKQTHQQQTVTSTGGVGCNGGGNDSLIDTTPTKLLPQSSSSSLSSIKKRQQRNIDASKFNRSNRKSKNCAIFYFKHLDTDNENFGLSSKGSDAALKSSEPSSDDEGWLFSNDCIDGGSKQNSSINDDSDKENKEIELNSNSGSSGSGNISNSGNSSIAGGGGEIQKMNSTILTATATTTTSYIMNGGSDTVVMECNGTADVNQTVTVNSSPSSGSSASLLNSNINCEIMDTNEENQYQKQQQQQQQHQYLLTTDTTSTLDANAKTVATEKSSCICRDTCDSATGVTATAEAVVSYEFKSGSNNHLKGEIDVDDIVTITTNICSENSSDDNNKSPTGTTTKTKIEIPEISSNKEFSHESIKQLVLDAENLIRDEIMRTPNNKRHATKMRNSSSGIKKREINMPGPNIKRVQEWLEHQPISSKDGLNPFSAPTTDCEASGEYTESDSAARESDTSEGFTDSVATCMQTGGSTSQCTSTEIIGGSAEPIVVSMIGSNPNLNTGICSSVGGSSGVVCSGSGVGSVVGNNGKVIRRTNRRNSDRPWSVSCLSQLTESETIKSDKVNNNQDLASHSVSESALHILSSPTKKKSPTSQAAVKSSDSKNSLRRRKARRRKIAGKKSDSGSDGFLPYDLPKLTQTLMKSESINGQINIIQNLTMALEKISLPKVRKSGDGKSTSEMESEEEQALMKPNFKVGFYTSAYMTNESKLGSLAALANYMNEERGEYHTGTEDHSSFSEQAWDNYQEKYNSENYSEGFDSDAARKLLEFGDDYRNFLDSQSDCCSSLSAANNFDSLSPPQMDSLKQNETMKITQQTITNINSSVDHARRRRALELQYERRRKSSESKRKSQDDIHYIRSPNTSSSTLHPVSSPKNYDKNNTSRGSNSSGDPYRKLDFDLNCSTQSLRKTSESDNNSTRRRKSDDILPSQLQSSSSVMLLQSSSSSNNHHRHRRSSKTLEKSFKPIPSTSSSSNDESDDEKEMKSLLSQSRNRLENTNALKIRSHLLRPEDYAEIVATCRDNIRCLESVLRGPSSTVLSVARINEMRDLLSSWENLFGWSENALAARKMQEEMVILKNSLNRLGRQTCEFDSDASIQFTIEELKNEKTQLQTYRTNMLRLNASVHSWLTRQEMKLKKEIEASLAKNDTENNNNNSNKNNDNNGNKNNIDVNMMIMMNNQGEKGSQIDTIIQSENEFHKHLKDEVSDMYSAWDEANARINNHIEALTASLIAWRQLECGLSEFHQVLGKDRGTLKGLEGVLNKGQATPSELAHNVKLVAKLLSEKMDCNQQQQQQHQQQSQQQQQIQQQQQQSQQVSVTTQDQQDGSRILSITQFTSSNGSLSDSGISDGGTTSDGGLSERERRLGVLRRLAKQLENALAPGSEALKSIAARMEAAEAELKTLQNTCRELIVRTAVSQQKKSQALVTYNNSTSGGHQKTNKKSPASKRRNRRRSSLPGNFTGISPSRTPKKSMSIRQLATSSSDPGDPDDPNNNSWDICDSDDESNKNRGWAWRVARIALPMQLALLTLFCAACLMEPHCCDSLNNLSMSFTPQLRYIRGPPPI